MINNEMLNNELEFVISKRSDVRLDIVLDNRYWNLIIKRFHELNIVGMYPDKDMSYLMDKDGKSIKYSEINTREILRTLGYL